MKPGDVVGERFELVARAGAGGMGEVFRARDRVTDEPAALKVLHHGVPDGGRFAQEARLLAELQHPGVVRHVASGDTGGARWLAMEWLVGETLEARLAREGLSTADAIDLAQRTSAALGAAHARGVVHRDVKPSNLFLCDGQPSRVKLLDFGIARDRAGVVSQATRTGVTLGTPGYMSPEQARGDRDVDARADVFSLGCVLFECLTGAPAFAGAHVMAILAKVLLEDPPRLDEILPDAPAALVELVARTLSKRALERPRDGAELARELSQLSALPSLRAAGVAARSAALGEDELRVVSVVLTAHAELDMNAETLPGEVDERMRADALAEGAALHALAGGSVVCALEGTGAVHRAARLALSLAAHTSTRVALATGRAQLQGRLPVGDAIDRAARLLRAPGPAIAVDEVSAAMLEGRFELRGGALLRERAAEEPARTLMGKPTTCVGRDAELRVLSTYFEACVEDERPQPVLLSAAAGVGKSRVAYELVRRLRAASPDVEIWVGRGDVMRIGSPLGIIRQALMSTAGMRHGEPIERLRAKIAARVARHVPQIDRARVTHFLGEILGAPFPDDDDVPLRAARAEAIVMADNTRRAFEDFVRAECAAHPVLMILEDLHWGDGATVSYTDSALRNLGELPWMVLAIARPEVHDMFPRLWAERELQEVKLGALSRKAGERLVREVLGDRASAPAVTKLVERAAGNAFFLEELIRAVAEGHEDSVPESVLAIVEQRLVSFEPEARRVLRAASVMGGTFWDGAVSALLGGTDARAWLRALCEAELVHARPESRFQGQDEYAFRHEVVRATAYGMLLPDDRALGHKLAATWLEEVGEQDALLVAEHWQKTGDGARAAPWFGRAAEQAVERHEWAAAVERAGRGVRCGASGRVLADLRRAQAEAQYWGGEIEPMARAADDALAGYDPGEERWFEATQLAVTANLRLGNDARVLELTRALERVEGAAADHAPRARALWFAALNLLFLGDAGGAARVAEVAGDTDDALAGAWRAVYRAEAGRRLGDVSASLVEQRRAWELFDRANDRRRTCLARSAVGYAQALLGDDEAAEATLRRALADSQVMGLRNVEAAVLHNLGPVVARRGRLAEAEEIERAALRALEAHGDKRLEAGSRVYLAEILLAAGKLDAAREEAARAAASASVIATMRPYALAVLARLERARGDLAAARAATDEAMRGVVDVEEGEAAVRLEHAE
ncbi:MAG TPA: protein kinase, partial [Byssovorax sp.]